ncbi:MAG: hypothetical protein CL817_01325 [Croceibacter sp.]|nr:hypothetical protein [Croceibacter sp.]|tara:strand:+ start:56 stop:979 length:924 start_codon:yes stop_codon:yes gene_type:complete
MNRFPSINVLVLTGVILLISLVVDFSLSAKDDFFQLNYDWDNLKTLKTYSNISLDSLSYNYLSLNNVNDTDSIRTDDTFSINDTYYFRSGDINISNNALIFKGVYWINSTPKSNTLVKTLSRVYLPLNIEGDTKICMIGDSQVTWQDGKETRKKILKKINDITFVGVSKDVYGISYDSDLLQTTKSLLNTLNNIPEADVYTLFIGAHEDGIDTIGNLKQIIDFFNKRNNQIILIAPYFLSTPKKEILSNSIRSLYTTYENKKGIHVIYIDQVINYNRALLKNDGIHLTKEGHTLLTKSLISILKSLK